MSRGLPGQHRRTTRRTRVAPAADPDPRGNRAQRRAWARERGAAQMPAEHHPQDIPPGTGAQAAHGAAGRHHGHSTDDTDEHYPWSYTQHGVLCACGQPMNADEQCPADTTERTTP